MKTITILALASGMTVAVADQSLPPEYHARPNYVGPRDRFWRHHRDQKTLVVNGVEHYQTLWDCMYGEEEGALSVQEQAELETVLDEQVKPNRGIGQRIVDMQQERWGNVILVEVQKAMAPLQVKAVQRLAHCVRTHLPQFYEVRAMYKEFNMEEDEGLGGNTPTHLMPFLGIYLPTIVDTVLNTVRFAYDHAGWQGITIRDKIMGNLPMDPDTIPSVAEGRRRSSAAIPMPEEIGFRASEHLTYDDFPLLEAHFDGMDTAFTVNFAFAGPEDYQGGYLYVVDNAGQKTFFKPQKYSCVVFLGGTYYHGVTRISGGRREMFSNELWFNPDLPLGNTLWNSNGDNMDDYIRACNKAGHVAGEGPCPVPMSDKTSHGLSREEILEHLDQVEEALRKGEKPPPNPAAGPVMRENDIEDSDEDEEESGEYWEEKYRYLKEQYRNDDKRFYNSTEEPDFIVPRTLEPGDVWPLYWRDNFERIKDDEAYAIGLPPELLQEFTKYVEASGLLDLARGLAYDTLPEDQKFDKDQEHKLYTLKDGQTWGTMRPQWSGNDMYWIDPGDEECFESLLHVLRKGNFDTVLQTVAELFDLDGLMVQGIGPIFLSHFDHDPNYGQIHHDLIQARGSFYNVIVPLYIPKKGATLYVGDADRSAPIHMRYNVGTLLGAGTFHGTGECDYRDEKDVRLSVAIYLADVNPKNVAIVASDSTSLWPSQGDVHWFKAQRGRLWRRNDPTRSLKTDAGRIPLDVQDKRPDCADQKDLCVSDPDGFRLECPMTCEVYMTDDKYYATLKSMVEGRYTDKYGDKGKDYPSPTCMAKDGTMEPTCQKATAAS